MTFPKRGLNGAFQIRTGIQNKNPSWNQNTSTILFILRWCRDLDQECWISWWCSFRQVWGTWVGGWDSLLVWVWHTKKVHEHLYWQIPSSGQKLLKALFPWIKNTPSLTRGRRTRYLHRVKQEDKAQLKLPQVALQLWSPQQEKQRNAFSTNDLT